MGITNLHNAGTLQGEVLGFLEELDRLNQRKAATLARLAEHFARLVHEKLVPGAIVNITDFNGGAYKARVIQGTHVQNTPIFRIDQLPVVSVDDRPLNSFWTTTATPVRAHDMKPYFTAVTLQGYIFQGRAAIDASISENENILHHFSLWQRAQPAG